MKYKIDRLKEFILDSLIDDYYNLWEPYSELKEYFVDEPISEEIFKELFFRKIIELQNDKLIELYEGTFFTGEEVKIEVPIDNYLFYNLLNDWKDNKKGEIRLISSEKGCLELSRLRNRNS